MLVMTMAVMIRMIVLLMMSALTTVLDAAMVGVLQLKVDIPALDTALLTMRVKDHKMRMTSQIGIDMVTDTHT